MKEKLFEQKVSINHPLARKVFGSVSPKENPNAYCRIVYFNTCEPKIIAAQLVYLEGKESEPSSFDKLIQPQMTFDESLIITSLYYAQGHSTIQRILQTKIKIRNQYLEFLLRPTNGYIIYCYQFEQLAQLILGVTPEASIELRKSFNKNRSGLDDFCLDAKRLFQLTKILKAHLVTGTVRFPNYGGAINLIEYAKLNQ